MRSYSIYTYIGILIGIVFLVAVFQLRAYWIRPVEGSSETKCDKAKLYNLSFTVERIFKHDTMLFTQGLAYHNGKLFESTGSPENISYTNSIVGSYDPKTGMFNTHIKLKNEYFGEGITFFNNELFYLTYKNKKCMVFNSSTFQSKGYYRLPNNEGWGITTDGRYLIISDGTDALTYFEPSNFMFVKKIIVTKDGSSLDYLNELEYIRGYIYANVWMSNLIVKIDPENGCVVALLDLSQIVKSVNEVNVNSDVLNGIAYDSLCDRIFITGKLWPYIYQIDFDH